MRKGSHMTEEAKHKISIALTKFRKEQPLSGIVKGQHLSRATEFKKGQRSFMKGKKHTEESKRKMSITQSRAIGEKSPNWNGGRYIDVKGYVQIYVPGYNLNGRNCIEEHRYIASQALGRRLKRNELVHHINGIKTDNRKENLLICSREYHNFLNNKMAFLYQQEHFGG